MTIVWLQLRRYKIISDVYVFLSIFFYKPDLTCQIFQDREERCLYGESAYSQLYGIMCPYPGGRSLGGRKREFNLRMSKMRIAVENAFGLTQNLFTKNAFEEASKIGEGPVDSFYKAAVLLTNCYTCLRGNQIGPHFLCKPPALRQYLSAINTV